MHHISKYLSSTLNNLLLLFYILDMGTYNNNNKSHNREAPYEQIQSIKFAMVTKKVC